MYVIKESYNMDKYLSYRKENYIYIKECGRKIQPDALMLSGFLPTVP
jgi:hypothetical protein